MSLSRRAHRPASWWPATALALVAAVALSAAPEASATRGITTGIAAPADYQSLDDSFRNLWFNRTVDANADLVRIDIVWYAVVGSERPANPRDPADPAYDFSGIDAAVRSAAQRGLRVLFTVYGAPEWAEGPSRPDGLPRGVWRPDAREYGHFGSALARRYSGRFPDPAGAGSLPRVRAYEAWNEPNLGEGFLSPQWVGKRAEGAAIYRRLLNSFYDAVKEIDPRAVVMGPATSPFGDDPGSQRSRPVRFLRELFCLKGRRKLEPQQCPRVRMDALSHHPIANEHPATYNAIHPDDASGGDLHRVKRVLRAAREAGVVRPRGKKPIWATEFWWVSDPPSEEWLAVPERAQARNIAHALYLHWKKGARVAIQYLIRDADHGHYQTGLFFADGKEKLALRAFRFPFVAERLRRKRVRAWGRSPARGRVVIQGRRGGGWKNLKRIRVRKGEVFTAKVRGSKRMRARIGGENSLVWRNRGGGGNR